MATETSTQTDAAPRRVAIFASYSATGLLPTQVLPYLAGLRPFVDAIVFVCDNDLAPDEQARLAPHVTHVIAGRHGEYDFGSYKRGTAWARAQGLLDTADTLILCNDSCFGPVGSFGPMFAQMEARGLDLWGATDSAQFRYHLQSYFIALTRPVFTSEAFETFLAGVVRQPDVYDVITKYELGLSTALIDAGFRAGAMVENDLTGVHPADPSYLNVTLLPLHTLARGLPLVKVKALRSARMNMDGPGRLLAHLREADPALHAIATADFEVARFESAEQIAFSVILTTDGAPRDTARAIAAVLAQTHRRFELIVVEDATRDGTADLIQAEFGDALRHGRLRHICLDAPLEPCCAQNVGLCLARNDWILHLGAGASLRPYLLTMIANRIAESPDLTSVCTRSINVHSGAMTDAAIDAQPLLDADVVDINAFVYRRHPGSAPGGFDTAFAPLSARELIVRQTRAGRSAFLPVVGVDHHDQTPPPTAAAHAARLRAGILIQSRHGARPTLSTLILARDHQKQIVAAIESALAQEGDFRDEILLCDGGSTDGTARIMARYAAKYPQRIRCMTADGSQGLAGLYRAALRAAAGDFIAPLEAADHWTDPRKNARQLAFLRAEDAARMVVSGIARREVARRDAAPALRDGADLLRDGALDLLASFSSCMLRTEEMQRLPPRLFAPALHPIALAFYLERIGKIGFLDTVSTSCAATPEGEAPSSHPRRIQELEQALRIARQIYHPALRRRIAEEQMRTSPMPEVR